MRRELRVNGRGRGGRPEAVLLCPCEQVIHFPLISDDSCHLLVDRRVLPFAQIYYLPYAVLYLRFFASLHLVTAAAL